MLPSYFLWLLLYHFSLAFLQCKQFCFISFCEAAIVFPDFLKINSTITLWMRPKIWKGLIWLPTISWHTECIASNNAELQASIHWKWERNPLWGTVSLIPKMHTQLACIKQYLHPSKLWASQKNRVMLMDTFAVKQKLFSCTCNEYPIKANSPSIIFFLVGKWVIEPEELIFKEQENSKPIVSFLLLP